MTHRLDRLVLEIHASDEPQGRQLLDRLSRLQRQTLLPVLGRVLDQLSRSDQLHRLETLEIDLGVFADDQLERLLPLALERALFRDLPGRLKGALVSSGPAAAPGETAMQADSEARLEWASRKDRFPRPASADRAQPRQGTSADVRSTPPERATDSASFVDTASADSASAKDPTPVAHPAPAADSRSAADTASAVDPTPVADSASAKDPAPAADSTSAKDPTFTADRASAADSRSAKDPTFAADPAPAADSTSAKDPTFAADSPAEDSPHAVAPFFTGDATPDETSSSDRQDLLPSSGFEKLPGLAATDTLPDRAAPDADRRIVPALDDGLVRPDQDPTTPRLRQAPQGADPAMPTENASSAEDTSASVEDPSGLELLAWFAATGTLPWWASRKDNQLIPKALEQVLAGPRGRLTALVRQLASRDRFRRDTALDRPPPDHSPAPTISVAPGQGSPSLLRLLHAARPEQLLRLRELITQVLAPTSPSWSPDPEPAVPPVDEPIRRRPNHPTPEPSLDLPRLDQAVHQAALEEGLAVDGAGLVLLWPFLETLMKRLALLNPTGQFNDEEQRQRALALLGFLVDGDPRPPEWRLSLPKLLCGLPLEAPATLDEDLSESDRQEAEVVLRAALVHGDGQLGEDMDTLRAFWLQRPGLLTWRPGAWLLVVERRDDVDRALERLPWSCSWIRLPWMDELVQVAW